MIHTKASQNPLINRTIPSFKSDRFSNRTMPIRNLFITLFVIGLVILLAFSILDTNVVLTIVFGLVLFLSGFVLSNLFFLNGSKKLHDISNRKILNHTSDLFLTYKIKNGKFDFVSSAIHRMLDYDTKSVKNQYDLSFVHPGDRYELKNILDLKFLRTNRNFQTELRMIKRDGSTIWVQIVGDVVVDAAHELDEVILNLRDISHKKEKEILENQYRKSLEQIIQKIKISESQPKVVELSTLDFQKNNISNKIYEPTRFQI